MTAATPFDASLAVGGAAAGSEVAVTPIVELSGIAKHYGDVVGVADVSLSIREGEFVTLLGPSGCGKSTLLRIIGGFECPTGGTIRIAGEDVTRLPPQKRDVNMMFQDYALFPHMTVGRNITYGLERKGVKGKAARDRADAALSLVGLAGMFDRHPHQLSGGQRQRVALARAVVREPKVILLDEPLSALDAKLREQMQVELRHMHAKLGITFIMVTHDQTEALVMSDRVVVMDKGRVAQEGTPEDVYERPQTPYVANFIGTTTFFEARVVTREATGAVLETAVGRLIVENPRVPVCGSKLRIGVRPEKAQILGAGQSRPGNVLPGIVVETIYLGLALRTVVRLEDGSEFVVDGMLPAGMFRSPHPRVGAAVEIGIEPQNIMLFGPG
ncbi:MAG: ABC transporter ATP-binding protein [Gemmobacter sp.]